MPINNNNWQKTLIEAYNQLYGVRSIWDMGIFKYVTVWQSYYIINVRRCLEHVKLDPKFYWIELGLLG